MPSKMSKVSFFVVLLLSNISFAERDLEKIRQIVKKGAIERFTETFNYLEVTEESTAALGKLTQADDVDDFLLSLIEDKGALEALRESAARTLRKNFFTTNETVVRVLNIVEDESTLGVVREALLVGAVREYATINSINETQERVKLILERFRAAEDPKLIVDYLKILSSAQALRPEDTALLDAMELLNHSESAVRVQAAEAIGRLTAYEAQSDVLSLLIERFDIETEESAKIAILKSLRLLKFTKPYEFLSRVANTEPSEKVKAEADISQMTLRGWVDPKTKGMGFLGGSPWNEPLFKQERINFGAKLMTSLSKTVNACSRIISGAK